MLLCVCMYTCNFILECNFVFQILFTGHEQCFDFQKENVILMNLKLSCLGFNKKTIGYLARELDARNGNSKNLNEIL